MLSIPNRQSSAQEFVVSLVYGLGFLWPLLAFSTTRELLSTGTIELRADLLMPFPQFADSPVSTEISGQPFRFPLLQPGAFLFLGFFLAGYNLVANRKVNSNKSAGTPPDSRYE